MIKKDPFRGPIILMLILLFIVSSPALPAKSKKKKNENKETEQLVWPLPPEKPRIKWLDEFFLLEDFKKESGFSKLLRKLSGQKKRLLFIYPTGVTTDEDHRVFVSDTAGKVIVVLDEKKRKVKLWSGNPAGLEGPTGLAYSQTKNLLFVADSYSGRIVALNNKGKSIMELKKNLVRPVGIALDEKRNRMYVVDVRGNCVHVFDLDGNYITKFGKGGSNPGEFILPNFIALDKKGNLYISDLGNFRIQILTPDGEPINVFGQPGKRPGDLMRPKGIAIDSENHIYVVDAVFNNVQIFDIYGRVYLAFGTRGSDKGQFLLPAGIYIDKKDRIFVVEQMNKRVQVFQYIKSGDIAPLP